MKKTTLRYQDFFNELMTGSHYGVFIDDTGSPGGSPSKLLPASRRTWVAVVIPPSQMRQTYQEFGALLVQLKGLFGVTELHFTDIYGGGREFAEVAWEDRLGIFETMARAVAEYGYPILIQSLDPSQLLEWRSRLQLPTSMKPFNFQKPEDTALFVLLLKVRMWLEDCQATEPGTAHVFVDEGWKKNGIGLQSSAFWGPGFDRQKVCFGSSKDIILLQLADFAAFVLNRMQLSGGKEMLKPKERQLLQVIQPMLPLYHDVVRMRLRIDEAGRVQHVQREKDEQ